MNAQTSTYVTPSWALLYIRFYTVWFFSVESQLVSKEKQPSRNVLKKKYSEKNIQQIYRRTPMLKCDFNELAKQLYWNCTLTLVFSCKFAAYLQNTFSEKHPSRAASVNMKFGQKFVQLMKNISNRFLPLLSIVETNSMPFYDFDKMEI